MVVPFGSGLQRRSRTTYRPTVTPEGSTHVDTAFTGTTSSVSRTAAGKLPVVAVVHQRVMRRLRGRTPRSANLQRECGEIGQIAAVARAWRGSNPSARICRESGGRA